MTKSSMKLQNESSYLGIMWYLFGPLLLFGILLFVFRNRLGSDIAHYPLYLLLGLISWNFFATGSGRSMTVFFQNAHVLRALPIPFELFVFSSVTHAFLSHLLELLLFTAVALFYGVVPSNIPLLLLVLFLSFVFTTGVGFFLATVYVFLRDVDQIWSVVTRAWWFATPIFYAPTPTGLGRFLSLFNPLYYVIHLLREVTIYDRVPPLWMFAALVGFATAALLIGYGTFRILRYRIMDLL